MEMILTHTAAPFKPLISVENNFAPKPLEENNREIGPSNRLEEVVR